MHVFYALGYALGPFVWGRGFSIEEAVRNMRRQTGKRVPEYTIYRTNDPDAFVSNDGSIHYHKGFYLEILKRAPKARNQIDIKNNDDLSHLQQSQEELLWYLENQLEETKRKLEQQLKLKNALTQLQPGTVCLLAGYDQPMNSEEYPVRLIEVIGTRGVEPYGYDGLPGRVDLRFFSLVQDRLPPSSADEELLIRIDVK